MFDLPELGTFTNLTSRNLAPVLTRTFQEVVAWEVFLFYTPTHESQSGGSDRP